nr:PREDICTED: protein D1-like isoform X1 [Bemisia tabaci]
MVSNFFWLDFETIFITLTFESLFYASLANSEEESVLHKSPAEIKAALEKHRIIPDLLDIAPPNAVQVEWSEGLYANFGNVIDDLGGIRDEPFWIDWPGDNMEDRYCLFMLGLDEPSQSNHSLREWKNWIVVNIEGYNTTVVAGEHLAEYVRPYPIIGTGLHRYVFLVYKQKYRRYKLFREFQLPPKRIDEKRGKFSVKKFAKKYNLDGPIAVNFFICEGKFRLTTTTTTTRRPRIIDPNLPTYTDTGNLIW